MSRKTSVKPLENKEEVNSEKEPESAKVAFLKRKKAATGIQDKTQS